MIQELLRNLSKVTILWAAFIVISASFMRQLFNFSLQIVTRNEIVIGLFCLLVAVGLLVVKLSLQIDSWKKKGMLLILLAGLFGLAISMPLPEEQVHIFKYGLLGYFAATDWKNSNNHFIKRFGTLFWSGAFCLLIALLDEGFQVLLPYRVGDLRDVAFDLFSSIVGAAICCLISQKNNPISSPDCVVGSNTPRRAKTHNFKVN